MAPTLTSDMPAHEDSGMAGLPMNSTMVGTRSSLASEARTMPSTERGNIGENLDDDHRKHGRPVNSRGRDSCRWRVMAELDTGSCATLISHASPSRRAGDQVVSSTTPAQPIWMADAELNR